MGGGGYSEALPIHVFFEEVHRVICGAAHGAQALNKFT